MVLYVLSLEGSRSSSSSHSRSRRNHGSPCLFLSSFRWHNWVYFTAPGFRRAALPPKLFCPSNSFFEDLRRLCVCVSPALY